MSDWDHRFLDMAALVSTWSKDPSTKVGAVITRGKFVVSLGFNGHPAGVEDSAARLENRETKYKTIIHAELNAILSARQPLEGCTLYVVPFMPCSNCGAVIVQAGIKRVVTLENNNERWAESFEITRTIFAEAGIDLVILPEAGE
ncbi:MAG TPA: dCMP deaminase family protein [Terracidiphilus sp.]|nr:dCMP deaminase family protein [Terracidiphilus sp.]